MSPQVHGSVLFSKGNDGLAIKQTSGLKNVLASKEFESRLAQGAGFRFKERN